MLSKTSLFYIVSVTMIIGFSAMKKMNNQELSYFERLQREYDNRAFSYRVTSMASKSLSGKPMGEFYRAYHELEKVNLAVYSGMQEKLGITYQVGVYTRLRSYVMGFLSGYVDTRPQLLIDVIEPYVAELKELHRVSPSPQNTFFEYVVAQEIAQLRASQAIKKLDGDAGAKVFSEFIASQKHYTDQFTE